MIRWAGGERGGKGEREQGTEEREESNGDGKGERILGVGVVKHQNTTHPKSMCNLQYDKENSFRIFLKEIPQLELRLG